ncbi:3' terminal RNA ribose 2'-O-methyltransferase Hen1 [Ruminococcus albus]|uniref:Small RNA 2'-O-methyltransferase n=1 Tax=Ruminococcus albus 8 TaxID=246199 RepID=E9SHU4_RUMAL|nr:3' terminal RNA ribose 2'-O-methyltransferase Hen1 [Ruminococcus albus]EGC01267.1 methyltransferase domain protein [Ruminococcus albus 8]MBE6874147.1 3' terminal RNA ribose 2'-O-methyltransferase Hen1 [Ruminococcus albus]MCC3349523.1 3' terminal RNA ribose 2'-O-methyltransferase Hen1 [Ruminococcus albus 8]
MLLTITYKGKNTQELGFLLHKNPDRAQQFELAYGKAYVFYPEVSDESTTAALLLDIDPLDLARGKVGSRDGGLFDYVNDRPYAATSFLSTAMVRIFGTAMNGKCDKRQELADTPLDLTARLASLKDNGDTELAKQLFEPLGYRVTVSRTQLDEKFPEWGSSPYIDLTISGKVKLSELLNHIYVLIPVFDKQKHYYMAEDEIKKLLEHGEGWLADHPQKEKITRRYFTARKSYARRAMDILNENEGADTVEEEQETPEKEVFTPLNTQRMETVRDAVLASGAASVIDLGCGECRLTSLLLNEQQIRRVAACDVSVSVLEKAAQRLHLDRMQPARRNKLTLMQASLTYRDKRFEGYDCACVVEVIEHIEPMRIPAFERAVFEFAAPRTVILTTPNREYNANYEHMEENALRHGDHRFEWTREEFRAWTEHICEKFGYSCEISGIGTNDEKLGTPTQMAVFTKAG